MMSNLNSVLIEGNLTRDPELKTLPSGTPTCTFGIATNRYYKVQGEKKQEVSYFDVEVWSKNAENCSQYLKKGSGVRVVGRLKMDAWTGEDGGRKTKVKIVAEHVEFKPSFGARRDKKDAQGGSSGSGESGGKSAGTGGDKAADAESPAVKEQEEMAVV